MASLRLLAAGAVAVALALAPNALPVRAADHGDAPGVRFDLRLDLNDVYAFVSPSESRNTVFMMTSNPLAGVVSPTTFHPSADYEFLVDTNGDAVRDMRFQILFSQPDATGVQTVRLIGETPEGREIVHANGFTGQSIPLEGGGALRAGVADDPFFFDLLAFRNGLRFCPNNTGSNFFRALNTLAIVLELPSSTFPTAKIGVWARTVLDSQQVDRNGRPAINTVFIPGASKDAFNRAAPPSDRALFRGFVIATLGALGNSPAVSESLADFLLPDILTIDTAIPSGFPNGRRLEDDVIDIELNLITGGAVKSDCANNDSAFRTTFPYWAPPNP